LRVSKIDTPLIYTFTDATQDKMTHMKGTQMTVVPITSPDLDAAEVSWFSALCSDDYEFLGVPNGDLRSSWEHCSNIVKEAEAQGFRIRWAKTR
jgi:hypothetical protein